LGIGDIDVPGAIGGDAGDKSGSPVGNERPVAQARDLGLVRGEDVAGAVNGNEGRGEVGGAHGGDHAVGCDSADTVVVAVRNVQVAGGICSEALLGT